MAKVIRYFSTAASGAGDGTTWADRAALFTGGAWSTVITGFSFAGSDSLECRVGPGIYTITASLIGISATSQNKFVLHGCDSSGNLLAAPVGWKSSQGEYDYSGFPNLQTSANITIVNTPAICRCLQFSTIGATSRTTVVVNSLREFVWCVINCQSTASSTALELMSGGIVSRNCIFKVGCPTIGRVFSTASTVRIINCRVVNEAATSGTRDAILVQNTNAGPVIIGNTIIGFVVGIRTGAGWTTSTASFILNNTIYGCSSHGIEQAHSGTPTAASGSYAIDSNLILNCGGWGIVQTIDFTTVNNNRIRDCVSGAISNAELDYDNITSAGTDADELVSVAGGDYRIKAGSAIWGLGIGAGDEPASGGGPALTPTLRGYVG